VDEGEAISALGVDEGEATSALGVEELDGKTRELGVDEADAATSLGVDELDAAALRVEEAEAGADLVGVGVELAEFATQTIQRNPDLVKLSFLVSWNLSGFLLTGI
jgi:predicted molibdopterin-dependent oxidoreductase YjgC